MGYGSQAAPKTSLDLSESGERAAVSDFRCSRFRLIATPADKRRHFRTTEVDGATAPYRRVAACQDDLLIGAHLCNLVRQNEWPLRELS